MREVLIVDDDVDMRRLLGSLLNRRGFNVTLAKSYGWGMILGKSHLPDLVIADVHLGAVFDGVQMSELLRRQNPRSRTIIISGKATDELESRIARAGFRFLPKPIRPNEILGLIDECLAELEAEPVTADSSETISVHGG